MSAKETERKQAETLYQKAKVDDPEQLVVGFVAVLAEEQVADTVRTQAAVLLRQLVAPQVGAPQDDKGYVFARCAAQTKTQVANGLLGLFEKQSKPSLQKKIGEVIEKIADAAYEKADQRGWLTPTSSGWPELLPNIFRLADPAQNPNAAACEVAILLLKELVTSMRDEIVQAKQPLGAVLQNSFAHADMKLGIAATLVVCEIVGCVRKKTEWAPLVATLGVMTAKIQQAAQAGLWEEVEECLKAFVDLAENEPDFFKQQLKSCMEPAKFMSMLVKTREGIENGHRSLALEFLVSYVEARPKWLAKNVPALPALAVECCVDLMLEVDDGESELKEWIERMDDEEGEEDVDELLHAGDSAIDRVVEAMGIESLSASLFGVIKKYSELDAWQAKHAALSCVRQTVEYVEENEHVDEMATLVLLHVDHAHPRVRYMALQAIGQISSDQAPHFQETWHARLMPQLLRKMDDPVDRVASMAMSAFVSFGGELDNSIMMSYAGEFMQKLVGRLQSSTHRMVQEECITSIAVIAGVIEKDFSQYYDGMMPLLKAFIMNSTGEKQSRLRGKAFECLSLFGLAVGKEKFLPDAREAIGQMLSLNLEADDVQRDYVKDASERICKCLKNDFAPYLPTMLPGIFKSLKLDGEVVPSGTAVEDGDDFCHVSTGDGKLKKVRTAQFEEATQGVELICTFCTEMEGAYLEWVQPTAQALLPFLTSDDDMAVLNDEARSAAFKAWSLLIKCAKVGAQERGQQSDVPKELLITFLQKIIALADMEKEPETLREAADGIAACLKNAGPGMLNGQMMLDLVRKLLVVIDQSFQRTAMMAQAKQEEAAGAPPELQAEEDDDDAGQDAEENCRRSWEEALGRVIEVAPAEFSSQCLPEVSQRMQQWLGSKENRTLGLFLACDIVNYLKEQSEVVWPIIMPAVFAGVEDPDPDVRIPAFYAINLAAPIQRFAQAAPDAFRKLATALAKKAPKKREEKARVAVDNAVAALLTLAKEHGSLCPADINPWQMIVAKLPLQEDEEEARKVHAVVADLVLAQHAGLLGPEAANLGKVLGSLAEVHKSENLSDKETDEKILKIFRMIPADRLAGLAGSITEKQKLKIQHMLR